MEVLAKGKYIKVQPRKVRIVADEIRGTSAAYSLSQLRYHTSKSARELRKVLVSAMANAAENHGLAPENLKIAKIMVDEGPRQKRMRARAMGRGNTILKKTAHITVVVEEQEPEVAQKKHGSQRKARPTFATAKKAKAKAAVKAEVVAPVEEVTPVEVAPVEAVAEETTPVESAPVIVEAPTASEEEGTK